MPIVFSRLPTIKQLQCFVAVAQELNFRRAAELLNMSQPPLSRQIQSLEDLLRIKLIERDTHHVSLTSAGEAFEREAHHILVALDSAVVSLRHETREKADVRLGLTSVIDFSLLPRLDAILSQPDFARWVRQERAYSKHLVERVRTGELDLAIVGDIPGAGEDLAIRMVARDPLMVALPARHSAAGKQRLSFDDLKDAPLFWFPRNDNPMFYDRCTATFAEFGYAVPRRPEPDDHAALLARIAAGDGIAFLPSSMRAASRIGVVYRPFAPEIEARLDIEIKLVWRVQETREDVLEAVHAILATVAGGT